MLLILKRACLPLYITEKAREVNIKTNLKPVSYVKKMTELCQKNILCKVLVSSVLVDNKTTSVRC